MEKNDTFSLFFIIVFLDINSLGPTIHKLCIPITKQVSLLVLQKFFQCRYDLTNVYKMANTQVGSEFREKGRSQKGLSLVSKEVGVAIQSESWLQQTGHFEEARYPEARARLLTVSLCVST